MEQKEKLEIDIELKDLLLEFVRRWKLLAVCMLIGGIALGAIKYASDYKIASTPTEPIRIATAEEVAARLNIDEYEAVLAALQLKAQVDAKTQYISNSILMQINPFLEDRIVIEYAVSGEQAKAALEYYESWIFNSGFLGEDSTLEEAVYINELVTVECDRETNVMIVKIMHTDAENCAKLAETVKNMLMEYHTQLTAKGIFHDCNIIQEKQAVVVDDALHQFQDAYVKETIDDQDELAKLKAEMNTNQITAYLLMEKEVFKRDEIESAEAETEQTGTIEEQNAVDVQPIKVTIDLKQVLLGMILGGGAAAVYVFLCYILTGKLRTAKEVEKLYQTRLLGTLYGKKLTLKQEVELLAASICIQCQKYGFHSVYVSGSNPALIPEEVVGMLKEALEKHEISVVAGGDVKVSADALMEAAQTGNILLVEKQRVSSYKEILKCVQTCGNNHIRVLGMTVLEK